MQQDVRYDWKKVMSGKEVARILEKNGWKFMRQKGSHMMFAKKGFTCVVPEHKEIKIGTLNSIKKKVIFVESN